jgi:pyrroline-5-carboxylate reductase
LALVKKLAIIGAGNIGLAIARGLVKSGRYKASQIILTRRKIHLLKREQKLGFIINQDNRQAVKEAKIIILAVEPQQIRDLLLEINSLLDTKRHILISVVSGIAIAEIQQIIGKKLAIVRAMPNTAIAISESMTCLASNDASALKQAKEIFASAGRTMIIDEEQMIPATALGACGVAFFLRAIRAASQGGIEIGFHPEEAIQIAAQTAKGAADLLLKSTKHPEGEIDRVTTPRGCTIAGLNRMEHEGFSSAMIRGIVTSCDKAGYLYIVNENNPKTK